jgi:hypothetical protein
MNPESTKNSETNHEQEPTMNQERLCPKSQLNRISFSAKLCGPLRALR